MFCSEQCGPGWSEEDSMLWHWCGGGRPTEEPDEQFPVLHHQSAGDCCTRDEGNTLAAKQTPHSTFLSSMLTILFCSGRQIHETIEYINQLKTERDFMLSFSNNPQDFIQDWLKSQSRDLKVNVVLGFTGIVQQHFLQWCCGTVTHRSRADLVRLLWGILPTSWRVQVAFEPQSFTPVSKHFPLLF